MLDLNPKYLDIIREILVRHIPNETVWIYGSRIKGSAHEGSDLDLAIISSDAVIIQKQLSAIRDELSESNLPILVDIVDWDTIPEAFKLEIENKHEVFQLK